MQLKAAAPRGTSMDMCFISKKLLNLSCRNQPLELSDLHPPEGGFRQYF